MHRLPGPNAPKLRMTLQRGMERRGRQDTFRETGPSRKPCTPNSRSFDSTPWTKTCPWGPRPRLPHVCEGSHGAPDVRVLRMTLRWGMESRGRQDKSQDGQPRTARIDDGSPVSQKRDPGHPELGGLKPRDRALIVFDGIISDLWCRYRRGAAVSPRDWRFVPPRGAPGLALSDAESSRSRDS